MGVDKDKIKEIVSVFYQAPFKVFYVNSEDGETFSVSENTRVFVSLGLSSPHQTLIDIKNILKSSGYKVRLAELKSIRNGNQFVNSITDKEEDQISMYSLEFPEGSYDKNGTDELLESLIKSCKNPDGTIQETGIKDLIREIQSIKELQLKLNTSNGWDSAAIIKDDNGDYKIFRKNSNFLQMPDDVSYRIGIYVEKE